MSSLSAPSLLPIPPLPDSLPPSQQQELLPVTDKGKMPAEAAVESRVEEVVVNVPPTPSTLTAASLVDNSEVAIVMPTSARSLRGQSSRSFVARTSSAPAPGSSATPIIAPSDLDCYLRIGMVPAGSGETAQQARTRHNENETHLATFLTTLERNIVSQDRVHRERVEELALISKTVPLCV
jgi:hypothetical protein